MVLFFIDLPTRRVDPLITAEFLGTLKDAGVESVKLPPRSPILNAHLEIERTMLAMPFEKFERKSFFRRLKDLAYVRFAESLWRKLCQEDLQRVQDLAQSQVEKYYARLALRSASEQYD